jgi:diguanylate cyclase (GGDEF)-like protein
MIPPINSRADAFIIGVLTPHTGGFYYGSVLKGVHHMAAARGADVFVVQLSGLDLVNSSTTNDALCSMAADGWVIVNEATEHPFVEYLAKRGIPQVLVSGARPDLPVCSVLPDNANGVEAAVDHLISLGHGRIAFLGNTAQFDVRERYEGYCESLRAAGKVVNPNFVFTGEQNLETDGRQFARQWLESRQRFSAVIAATDKLAIGAMSELLAAGIRIPEEVAFVGFDDIDAAQYIDPPLTTVRQNFATNGAEAVKTLMNHLEGQAPLPSRVRVEVALVIRQSCGWRAITSRRSSRPVATADERGRMERALLDLAGERRGVPLTLGEWPEVVHISARLMCSPEDAEWDTSHRVPTSALWKVFCQQNRNADSISRAIALMERYATQAPVSTESPRSVRNSVLDLRSALLRSWQQTEQARTRQYEFVAETNARISQSIARAELALGLEWMELTSASYGALALWQPAGPDGRRLEITAEYALTELTAGEEPWAFDAAAFPPRSLLRQIRAANSSHTLVLVPVSGLQRNYGILLSSTPFDRELSDHALRVGDWGAQLGAALDQAYMAQTLRNIALQDELTGLPNRAALLGALERLTATADPNPFALLFLDLDDFKKVNDSLGHHAGDQLLIEVARRLSAAVAESGLVARLGGDEFVVLLPDCADEPAVGPVLTRIREWLNQAIQLEGSSAYVSCSVGVALGRKGAVARELLRNADTAMYQSKLHGRNCSTVFRSAMHDQAMERLRLEAQLRRALNDEQFELVYQPILNLAARQIVGAEALIRWKHPEHGYISPGRFIPIVEESGLIVPLGSWVLRQACTEAAAWQTYAPDTYVSVNVAPAQLKELDFVDKVTEALALSRLPAKCLTLEIVENCLVERLDATSVTLEQLRDLGVRIAIDDFGTGYSSLQYLRRLPIDMLKLDRVFIDRLPTSREDVAIVSSVMTMGFGLGLTIVAEGVETAAQAEFLSSAGCPLAQGFLFSKPQHVDQWRETLRQTQERTPESTRRTTRLSSLHAPGLRTRPPQHSAPPASMRHPSALARPSISSVKIKD